MTRSTRPRSPRALLPAPRRGRVAAAARRRARSAPAEREGAALCLRGRRDQLRSGARSATSTRARVTPHIFEAPVHLRPPGAAGQGQAADGGGMPEVSADFRVWTVRIKPGIYFADDPAFKGKRRELVAAGLRLCVQALRRPGQQEPGLAGLDDGRHRRPGRAARRRALDDKKPFDYDRQIEGMRALDRYTLRFKLDEPRPRFLETLRRRRPVRRGGARGGRVLRRQIEAHPVGTGPFRLEAVAAQLAASCSSATPTSARCSTTPSPPPTMPRGRRCSPRFKGRRLPMVDRVEISIIEEEQPRWLRFLNGEADVAVPRAGYRVRRRRRCPNGKLAPNLAKRGIRMATAIVERRLTLSYFNMEDPVVGGYAPDKVALRRAIGSAYDIDTEIRYASGAARRCRRRRRCCRTPAATTRAAGARSATTTRRAPRRCSTCTATSTATATAGASCPTARRCVLHDGDRSPTQIYAPVQRELCRRA